MEKSSFPGVRRRAQPAAGDQQIPSEGVNKENMYMRSNYDSNVYRGEAYTAAHDFGLKSG